MPTFRRNDCSLARLMLDNTLSFEPSFYYHCGTTPHALLCFQRAKERPSLVLVARSLSASRAAVCVRAGIDYGPSYYAISGAVKRCALRPGVGTPKYSKLHLTVTCKMRMESRKHRLPWDGQIDSLRKVRLIEYRSRYRQNTEAGSV